MGFSIFSNNGQKAYGIKNFIVDTPSDIDKLSTDYIPGCQAFVIANSAYYMLNHQKQWVKITPVAGSTSGNTDLPDPEYNYVYNGGEP